MGAGMTRDDQFSRDSQNVDTALTRFAQVHSPVFLSGTKTLILLWILVAGAGFEPAAFRL